MVFDTGSRSIAGSAACVKMGACGSPAPTTLEVRVHFDALYAAVSSSRTHAEIGHEALGDGFVGQLGCASEAELYELAERAGVRRDGRTLELCCGIGGICAWLVEHTRSFVTGIDISSVGVGLAKLKARENAAVNLHFVVGEVGKLPFATASIDSIVCLDGFGADFSRVFDECRRVLRPNGALAFLLNVPRRQSGDVSRDLRCAGFEDVCAESVVDRASILMRRWLRAYKGRATEHIAEVGRYTHQALTWEMADLLERYHNGTVERLLLSGVVSEE